MTDKASDNGNGPGSTPITLTVREAAKALGARVRTVQKWLNQGHFPGAYKLGPGTTSPWRIPQTDVDTFLAQRQPGPPAKLPGPGADGLTPDEWKEMVRQVKTAVGKLVTSYPATED